MDVSSRIMKNTKIKISDTSNRLLSAEEKELIGAYVLDLRNLVPCRESTGVHDVTIKRLYDNGRGKIKNINKVLGYCRELKKQIELSQIQEAAL